MKDLEREVLSGSGADSKTTRFIKNADDFHNGRHSSFCTWRFLE